MEKLTITEDLSQSYNELKSGLKEKYLNMLYGYVDEAREKAIELSADLISDDMVKLTEETKELKRIIKKETKSFYKSDEYVNVQQRLVELKEKLNTCSDEEKEEIQKQISKSMAEVVTKNITIKNRLKPHSDKVKYNEEIINAKMQEIDGDVQQVREEVMDFLRDKIAICIKYYNDELRELNDSFKMPQPENAEIPFDSKVIQLDVPIFELYKSEPSVEKDYEEDSDVTIIASENQSAIKN